MKKGILALFVVAVAAAALGDLSKYKDWARSPEAYFLTPPEREEWAKLKSDEEAEKFIQLYWAKRGGDAFKQEISRRMEAADQQFKMRRYERGAQSVRGHLLVVLGPPNKQMREREQEAPGNPRSSGDAREDLTTAAAGSMILTWIYEKDHFPAEWGVGELRAKILIDQARGIDELQIAGPVERALATVAEKSIIRPSEKVAAAPVAAPAPAARPASASAAAAPPAPAAVGLPAAVHSILEGAPKGRAAPEGAFWGGPFRTLAGDPFYAFELSLPAEKAAAGVKVGGFVTTESGEEKASFWEDATFIESKTGAAVSKLVLRSVELPPGAYRGAFGLFAADGSAALVSAASEFKLEQRPGELEISPLLLTNVLTPLGRRAKPAEPFIFGKPEKPILIVPKANRLFTNQDGLWYFYTLRHPAKPQQAPASAASSPTPAAGAAVASPPDVPRPRIMMTINVLRDGKPAYQESTAPIDPEPLGEDTYGEGKEIPLNGFTPGYYSLVIKVRDLNAPSDSVANKGIERRSDFVVLKPDASMPDKPSPTPAVKAPAKKG